MADKQLSMSGTELDVLKVLWEHGAGTVREISTRLRRGWAYTTVQTLLTRLESKGYVSCDKSGFAHVFHPVVSRELLLRRRLSDLTEQLCEGAAVPLVLALVESHRFSAEEIEEFRRLLDRLQAKQPKKKTRKKRRPGNEN